MMTLFAFLCLAAQDPAARSAADAVRDLSHDQIEIRERAHADLIKIGAPAYHELRRALQGDDAEARTRAAEILRAPAFLAVPEVVEANLRLLREERWLKAAEDLLKAGPPAAPAIRKAAEKGDAKLAFRAGQVAAILESPSVRGLRFGILVENPESGLDGPVAGWDVLINTSAEPLRFDGNSQSWVYSTRLESDAPQEWATSDG
jgi:hypothetical protein